MATFFRCRFACFSLPMLLNAIETIVGHHLADALHNMNRVCCAHCFQHVHSIQAIQKHLFTVCFIVVKFVFALGLISLLISEIIYQKTLFAFKQAPRRHGSGNKL